MRPRFTGLWRHHDFMRLWAGSTISVFGSLVSRVALPFLAVLTLDASPLQMALLTTASVVPQLAFGLVAGVWVDRLRRRPILIASDLARALLLCWVPLASVLGVLTMEQLYVVAGLTGALTVFFDVAYLSYLPVLVGRDDLVEGNSKLSASASVAEVGAFGIAGWLVQALTAPFAVFVDAASFVASALFVGGIRAPEPPPPEAARREGMRTEIVEGLRVVIHHPLLRAGAAASLTIEFGSGIVGTVILLYVTRGLGFAPGLLGMIFAVGGATSLIGAMMAGPMHRRLGVGPTMIVAVLIAGGGVLLVPLAQGATVAAALLLVAQQCVTDPFWTIFNISEMSLRQGVTPDHVLGRVNGSVRVAGLAALLAGTLTGGLLGETIGVRGALVAGGCAFAFASVWLLVSPARGLCQMPSLIEDVTVVTVPEPA